MENKYQINSNVLEEIIKKTREDVEVKKKNVLANVIMSEMKNPVRSFVLSLSNVLRVIGDKVAIIGEIKFASPSEGFLGSPEDFIKRIKEYEKAGMDAVSIVTEKHFFKGDSSFVTKAKQISKLPILQKDFVVDEYQIYQAKKAGADAVLLIARIVSKKELVLFVKLAKGIGVEPVVEVHNNNDLAKALATKTKIIAVNARDLSTFKIDVDKACLLLKRIPDVYIRLGFSGIHSRIEVEKYKKAGANGVLIGTSLMKTKSVKEFLLGVLPSLYPASARSDFAIYEAADELRAVGSPSARSPLASTIKVKICGIRSLEAARAAVEAGADFLGFNFVPTSKRLILVNDAKEIINAVKGKVKIVGVFQNQPIEYVNNIVKKLNLDFVQLHGKESAEYCRQIQTEVIKAIPLPANFSINKIIDVMRSYGVSFYLIDREKQGQGKIVDVKKAKVIAEKFPIIFAGGLTIETVESIQNKVRPYAVDVAGGIETNGVQDLEKIRKFIKDAKGGFQYE